MIQQTKSAVVLREPGEILGSRGPQGRPGPPLRAQGADVELTIATRFDLKYGMVGLPHDAIMRTIELYGAKVVPLVPEMLADTAPHSSA